MKVIHLTPSLSRSGAGLTQAMQGLLSGLKRQGVEVAANGFEDEQWAVDQSGWGDIEVEVFPKSGPGFWPMSRGLKQRLESADMDLLHVHGLWQYPNYLAARIQEKRNVPVIVSPHGMLDPWALKHSGWKKRLVGKWFQNRALRETTCIHALTEPERDSIQKYFRTPSHKDEEIYPKVMVIPNGVYLPEALGAKREGPAKRILFLGRIHPKKGLKELIEAWARTEHSDITLTIAGWDDGGYEGRYREQVERGKNGNVEFIGPVFGGEKDILFRSADIFILPSYSEGLPMAILEAWSYGIPVIMTRHCNLPEGFEAGAAWECDPNSESISDTLKRVLSLSEKELSEAGKRGRGLVKEKFSWDAIAAEMKEVYRWMLGEREAPGCIRS